VTLEAEVGGCMVVEALEDARNAASVEEIVHMDMGSAVW
jgi:hypothetical protein